MDLFSINYIHTGAAKQWYCIPPSQAERFETFAQTQFFDDHKRCSNFLRHKHTILAPWVLREAGMQVNQVVHNAGEFMYVAGSLPHCARILLPTNGFLCANIACSL